MGRIVIGVAGSVVAAALLAGCQSRQVMVLNHGEGEVRVARVHDGAERAIVYAHTGTGGGFPFRPGDLIVMGDAELRVEHGHLMIVNRGLGTIETSRPDTPGRMLVGPSAEAAYALDGEPVIIDDVEVRLMH